MWLTRRREEWLIYRLSAAHRFDSLAVSLVFIRIRLSLIWWVSMNGLNIPKRSLTRANQPSLPQPFPGLPLLPPAQVDTLNCLVSRLGGQRVRVSAASGDRNNSRYSVILCVSMKKCEPVANAMFPLCDSAAVPMCSSVKALKDAIIRAANND